METEYHSPTEENLGKDCMFWAMGQQVVGCCYPKAEIEGRLSCEGVIDDVCLFILNGRPAGSLTKYEMQRLKTRPPNLTDKSYLPPGGTT